MTNGTEWTEAGQGASFVELWHAVLKAEREDELPGVNTIAACQNLINSDDHLARTNLRLTGLPLKAYDVRRIEVAK